MSTASATVPAPVTAATFKSDYKPIWCPGCGDYSVLSSITKALAMLKLQPENVAAVSGIGCSSRIPAYTTCYGFHGVHGRSLAAATSDEDPLVALHRVLSRLAELAEGDPEPARALLAERVAVKLRHGGDLQEMDIRLEVPIVQTMLPAIERMDLGGREPVQVASILCDALLTLAIDRVGPQGDVAALAMRLLPPSASGIEPWAPPSRVTAPT